VITQQEDTGPVLLKLDQPIDHPARVRAPVDIVTEKDQSIAVAQGQRLQQFFEFVQLAVYITNGVKHEVLFSPTPSSAVRIEHLTRNLPEFNVIGVHRAE
jgi:hypothetical protein